MAWNFHEDDSQENVSYNMILSWDVVSELKVDLCLSDYTIKVNGGAYKGCMKPMKDVNKVHIKTPIEHFDDGSFRN